MTTNLNARQFTWFVFFQGFFGLFKENCVFLKNKMDKHEALKKKKF